MRTEHVSRLLEKARQDEYVLDRLLDDPAAPVEVFGFHAQQAVEKMLKAVLACASIVYPRTHRIVELIDLLRKHDVEVPGFCEDLRELTPFAVDFRYDAGPGDNESLLQQGTHS